MNKYKIDDSSEIIYTNNIDINSDTLLTIASPFYNDDPSLWIEVMKNEPAAKNTQLILIDDCSTKPLMLQKAINAIQSWPGSAKIVHFEKNQGRSKARNRAIELALCEYILFIDADMMPYDDKFISRYIEIIKNKSAAVVYGGFTTKNVKLRDDTKLHHYLSEINDCQDASIRKFRGAAAVASNNLLVRTKIMHNHPFDDSFKGWGWEDTEWALRIVNESFGLIHIDNPAIHTGLDSDTTVLRKYKEAGENLKIMLNKHPIAEKINGTKVARFISIIFFHKLFRPIAKFIVLNNKLPINLRILAIKFWRASYAAEALKQSN